MSTKIIPFRQPEKQRIHKVETTDNLEIAKIEAANSHELRVRGLEEARADANFKRWAVAIGVAAAFAGAAVAYARGDVVAAVAVVSAALGALGGAGVSRVAQRP